MSYIQGQEVQEAKEAIESARASLSQKKKKKKEKDQGRWSVATRRGREKEEKKKTKEGERMAPAKARFRVPSTKNFFFWFTSIWVLRDPSRLKYRLLRDLVCKEAMCEGSSGNGLPYAGKAVPEKDYFTQVEDPAVKHS
jgi:hypothetical protein